MKGVEPLELPAYRFYNLALYYLQEGKDDEQLVALEKELASFDSARHPLHDLVYKTRLRTNQQAKLRVEEVPVEEKHAYVPSWWRGESVNAKVAMNMMKKIPKTVGSRIE